MVATDEEEEWFLESLRVRVKEEDLWTCRRRPPGEEAASVGSLGEREVRPPLGVVALLEEVRALLSSKRGGAGGLGINSRLSVDGL